MKKIVSISRRNSLKNIAITTLGAYLPTNYLFANINVEQDATYGLEQQIIDIVKKMIGSREVSISILQPKGSLGNIRPVGEIFSEKSR